MYMMYLNLRVYLFVFVFVVELLFSFFIVFVNFSNVHWFSVKIKVSDWVGRNLFSLAVFVGNLLAGFVHSSLALDRHVQVWQWIGSICYVTWILLWASACSLEAWGENPTFQIIAPLFYYLNHFKKCITLISTLLVDTNTNLVVFNIIIAFL